MPKAKVAKKTTRTRKKVIEQVEKHDTPVKKAEEHVVEKVVIQRKETSQFYALGRRKEAVARVYYYVAPKQEIIINNRTFDNYFPHQDLQRTVLQAITLSNWSKGKWVIRVSGGGKKGQADSIRLGVARILAKIDVALRPTLKKAKLLSRDPRVKERKKYGLKRARRAPQWQKR